jgi:nicotinamide-nucleotide amidase
VDLEVVTVGTELLLGFTVDSNSADIGRQLARVGVRVTRRTSVADDSGAIRDAVGAALGRSQLVLITGGLGPTRDDITKHTVADLFGAPLEFHDDIWQELVERWGRLGRRLAEANRTQAMVPQGATVLANRWGTAPGLWLEGQAGIAIMLPGVPREMRGLLEHEVVPRLAARGAGRVIRSRTLRTTGIPESSLSDRIGPIEAELAPLTLAYLPGLEGVDLRVTCWDSEPADADRRLAAAIERLRASAGSHVYGEEEADLAAVVLEAARKGGTTVAVAESCTGGLVGGRLTAVAGSSDVFRGGVIAYHDEAKRSLLDVPAEVLEREGAVSEAVARLMAEGAARRLGAGAAVAVTGIAGPAGGSAEKPVGTICFATTVGGVTQSSRTILPGARYEIRTRATQLALYLLLVRLQDSPGA